MLCGDNEFSQGEFICHQSINIQATVQVSDQGRYFAYVDYLKHAPPPNMLFSTSGSSVDISPLSANNSLALGSAYQVFSSPKHSSPRDNSSVNYTINWIYRCNIFVHTYMHSFHTLLCLDIFLLSSSQDIVSKGWEFPPGLAQSTACLWTGELPKMACGG